MPAARKTITFEFTKFWTAVWAAVIVLCGAFWAIHQARVTDIKESFIRHQDEIQELYKKDLVTADRNYDTKLELLHSQYSAELRIKEQERDHAIEALRAELAAARSTVELHADSGYMSVKDLVVDPPVARKLVAGHSMKNIRRLLLPDYETRGWTWNPDLSLVQILAMINKQEFPLRPGDVKPTDAGWWPIVNVFSKVGPDFEAYVGTFDFAADDIYETDKVIVGKDQIPKEITRLPVGMMGMSFALGMLLEPDTDREKVVFKEFSAKSDAFYITSAVSVNGKEYANEFLIMREGKTVFCTFSGVWSKNAVDPIRKEVADWTKAVRIVRDYTPQ